MNDRNPQEREERAFQALDELKRKNDKGFALGLFKARFPFFTSILGPRHFFIAKKLQEICEKRTEWPSSSER